MGNFEPNPLPCSNEARLESVQNQADQKVPIIDYSDNSKSNDIIAMNFSRDQRTFGRELTNLLPQFHKPKVNQPNKLELRPRGYSFGSRVHDERNQPIRQSLKMVPEQTKDPQNVDEYLQDIVKHIRAKQLLDGCQENHSPKMNNLCSQKRSERIAWMIDVHRKFKLFPHTLYLAIRIFDKCFSTGNFVSRTEELAITSLFISAKYEETYRVPKVRDIVAATRCNKSERVFYEIESEITSIMNFDFVYESSYRFLEVLCRTTDMSTKNFHLAQYIIELGILDGTFSDSPSSLIGCAAFYLVSKVRKVSDSWPLRLGQLTGYTEKQLQQCARSLLMVYENSIYSDSAELIRKKFSMKEYSQVTNLKLERKKSNNA